MGGDSMIGNTPTFHSIKKDEMENSPAQNEERVIDKYLAATASPRRDSSMILCGCDYIKGR